MIIISPLIRMAFRIATIILYIVTIAAAYGGYCNPDYSALPSVLVLALPYLAIATLIAGILWIITKGWITGLLAFVVLYGCWGTLKDVTPLSKSREAYDSTQTFRLITFNCLHFADTTKSSAPGNRAITYLTECGAEIICLQEMVNLEDASEIHHWSRQLIDSLYAAYPYRAGSKGRDLKILSKYPVKVRQARREDPEEERFWEGRRRWEMFEVNINGFRLPIVDFHMNSYELTDTERGVVTDIKGVTTAKRSYSEFRNEIFPKLGVAFRSRAASVEDLVAATKGLDPIIACGDFNDVPGSWSYRLMRNAGFNDAYSETNFGPTNTFNQFMLLFHIDQIFYRGATIRALNVKRLNLNTSDHYPLEATFEYIKPRNHKTGHGTSLRH
ncbi:MAG: endonuclease/exonuclease/phosphatase family protein [Muribaculum sp.]|nr:endonuclease/exonuclease/phosphatase family protein [Muribaculum sp.]